MLFKIGADPELFLITKEKDKFISSIGRIGGSKHIPKSIGNGCAIQEDNVAVEFNIPACSSFEEFQKSIAYAMREINNIAKQQNLTLATNTASALFNADQLNCQAALVFGCDPDYNAWLEKMNPRPKTAKTNLRSCGGHIHIGLQEANSIKEKFRLIKLMDKYLGLPSITIDKDTERRLLYGKAGACRLKSYGAEYRTLSNFWIWKKHLVKWAYDSTQKAVEAFLNGETIGTDEGNQIQHCINTGDLDVFKQLNRTYKLI